MINFISKSLEFVQLLIGDKSFVLNFYRMFYQSMYCSLACPQLISFLFRTDIALCFFHYLTVTPSFKADLNLKQTWCTSAIAWSYCFLHHHISVLYTGLQWLQWRSQPKNWGGRKICGGQNVWFSANNAVVFRKTPLKAQNHYIHYKFERGHGSFAPPLATPLLQSQRHTYYICTFLVKDACTCIFCFHQTLWNLSYRYVEYFSALDHDRRESCYLSVKTLI